MAAPRYITQQICSVAQLATGVLLHATVAVFATHVPPAASHVAAPPLGAGAPAQIAFGGFDFCRLHVSVEQPASRQAAPFSAKQHSPLLVSTMYSHEVASARAVPPTPHSDTSASPAAGSPLQDPVQAYETIMGLDTGDFEKLILRQRSVNDLVRAQMEAILGHPRLSALDRQRLELHRDSIRDLENTLSCTLEADLEAALAGEAAGHASDDGDLVLEALRAHMRVAALAVACGYTRAISIQVGGGGTTRYRNLDNGELMENYHYISHRRLSHDNSGALIPDSDLLHHHVDIHHARAFTFLLERLDEYVMPDGLPLLDAGLAVWWNENAHGEHFSENIPYVIAGSAGGFLRQGVYVQADDPGTSNHRRMLQTLGSAVGLRNAEGDFLDDFGDPALPGGVLPSIMA